MIPADLIITLQTILSEKIYGVPRLSKNSLKNDVEKWLNNTSEIISEFNCLLTDPAVSNASTRYRFLVALRLPFAIEENAWLNPSNCVAQGHFVAVQEHTQIEHIQRFHEVLVTMINGNYGGMMGFDVFDYR